MAFEFESRRPVGALSRWLRVVWFARGRIEYRRELIAPSGATVAVLNLGDPIVHATQGPRSCRLRAVDGWISGPHDRPSLNEPCGGTHCYGVVSTSIGCEVLFGLDPRELRGRLAPLGRWSAGPRLRAELEGQAPERGLPLLLERLAAGLSEAPPRVGRVERAVGWLERDPGLPVGEIARRLGLSHAHLDREFARLVGLGPRRMAAILRIRRLLERLDVFSEPDWADLTTAHGYYDQSHMIRDFKRYTGVTPTAYVAAQRAHIAPAEALDAQGFVPQGPSRHIKSVQDREPPGVGD